ncbi:hypothetical protein Pan216_31160 [Planctomycetes bacterium Pan216]|uniref:Uncharacterized protein n=1 Tax=Kolteria novifilia TaxID=2527975 RepID=A0A518B5K4_9BACT|nr:hypothetical protein Pan216_31160 [Planctomycetes bacterium Pan216]
MRLDQARIEVRQRSHADVLDLALVVIRRWWLGLSLTAAAGILPCYVLNSYLLERAEYHGFLYFLLIVIEIPWATALMTLYLGQVTFLSRVSVLRLLRDFVGSLWQLIIYQTILRGVLSAVVVTFPFVAIGMKYLNEIILLERARWLGTSRRMSFHSPIVGEIFLSSLADMMLGCFAFFVLLLGLNTISEVWNDQWSQDWFDFEEMFSVLPYFGWQGRVSLWLVISYFAVVRYLAYLNVRIRREGWDVELKLRAERARLLEEPSWKR